MSDDTASRLISRRSALLVGGSGLTAVVLGRTQGSAADAAVRGSHPTFLVALLAQESVRLDRHLSATSIKPGPSNIRKLRASLRRIRLILGDQPGHGEVIANTQDLLDVLRSSNRSLGKATDLHSLRRSVSRLAKGDGTSDLAPLRRHLDAELERRLTSAASAARSPEVLAMAQSLRELRQRPAPSEDDRRRETQQLAERRLAAVRAASPSTIDAREWHRARKAVRAYRYALAQAPRREAQPEVTERRRSARALQRTLGEWHDLDVGADELDRLAHTSPEPLAAAARAASAELAKAADSIDRWAAWQSFISTHPL